MVQSPRPKQMCVSDHPTDSPFFRRPTHVFLLCEKISEHFEISYEVLRQNLSKISAKMDNSLILEEKSHSRDNKKNMARFCRHM